MVFTLVGQRSVLNSSWVNQNDVYVVEGAELTIKQIDRFRYDGGSSESVTGGTESVSLDPPPWSPPTSIFFSAQGPPRFLYNTLELPSPIRPDCKF